MDTSKFIISRPCNIKFEISVIKYSLQLLNSIFKARFKSTLDDDLKLIEDPKTSGKMQFALMYRISSKRIVLRNIEYLTLLQKILDQIQLGKSVKEAYMLHYDDDKHFLQCRRVFRKYLLDLTINMEMIKE